ncbi:WXG100 family type VII secretion target [Streptosporangium roseum]|uniref:WXG100 family type VII secretion target n=1 Tax=Streptosporangium roseum TaxID=2001 RepID=UPI00068C5942|nr:WXG100 family type VII secretion target [Streptosporangium roseum]
MVIYDGYEVDPQALRQRATAFTSAGTSIEGAKGQLRAALAAGGSPWGDDQYGRQFEKGYEPLMKAILQKLDETAEALHEIKRGLDVMASRYEEVARQSTIRP